VAISGAYCVLGESLGSMHANHLAQQGSEANRGDRRG
jgi:hypothetical protein